MKNKVFRRKYMGRTYVLRSVKENGEQVFRSGKKVFTSLTAAAKAITGYASISGPVFWNAYKEAK